MLTLTEILTIIVFGISVVVIGDTISFILDGFFKILKRL